MVAVIGFHLDTNLTSVYRREVLQAHLCTLYVQHANLVSFEVHVCSWWTSSVSVSLCETIIVNVDVSCTTQSLGLELWTLWVCQICWKCWHHWLMHYYNCVMVAALFMWRVTLIRVVHIHTSGIFLSQSTQVCRCGIPQFLTWKQFEGITITWSSDVCFSCSCLRLWWRPLSPAAPTWKPSQWPASRTSTMT